MLPFWYWYVCDHWLENVELTRHNCKNMEHRFLNTPYVFPFRLSVRSFSLFGDFFFISLKHDMKYSNTLLSTFLQFFDLLKAAQWLYFTFFTLNWSAIFFCTTKLQSKITFLVCRSNITGYWCTYLPIFYPSCLA